MSVKMRQKVEREIAAQVIKDVLAAGYTIDVNNGEDTVIAKSADADKILAAMFTTDQDTLMVYEVTSDAASFGWVTFIYGNDGYDVVHDYTTNLEAVMTNATKLADDYS